MLHLHFLPDTLPSSAFLFWPKYAIRSHVIHLVMSAKVVLYSAAFFIFASQKLTASNVTSTITTKGSSAFKALEVGIQMAVQTHLNLKYQNQTVLNR